MIEVLYLAAKSRLAASIRTECVLSSASCPLLCLLSKSDVCKHRPDSAETEHQSMRSLDKSAKICDRPDSAETGQQSMWSQDKSARNCDV